MGLPDDVVLYGYTLIEQHEIDHEFLINGSPFAAVTPLLFALTIAGMLLVAGSFFLRGSRRIIAGLLGAVLTLTKLWWMPLALARQFNDSQVFGYALKYYPQYWPAASIIVIVIALLGLASAFIRRR
ncbi:hypothetical protein [Corynebacterium aurimucosum]|uniref:Putative membrane protein n=1 Tax=Corynebacterium aurimucosum (strain ATCC 700975 / DSM 44827 / CIP 107346 / CN-1) TaxID=548476 RepID=C3PHX1_CORA7|nr:hypothetical protein [Corynebacterium aurimucosum]ACP33425.1 putative membrane protein [Corynebacterium aurimucosum ATCC 700975]QQU92460.1 hypothetical protein I6I67_09475 [Corynebacterium aurimucosum]